MDVAAAAPAPAPAEAEAEARQHFGAARLGDARRTKRLVRAAKAGRARRGHEAEGEAWLGFAPASGNAGICCAVLRRVARGAGWGGAPRRRRWSGRGGGTGVSRRPPFSDAWQGRSDDAVGSPPLSG